MIDLLHTQGTLTLPTDLEIEMKRAFRAPAALLFDVWTKPEHVRRWYGVRSTTVTVCEIDLRVGGAWRWVVEKPNGFAIAFSGVFREIEPPRRLQRTEIFEGMPGEGCLVTISFDESDGLTTLTMNMRFASRRERDMTLQSGMESGVQECYANIDKLIAEALRQS